MLNFESKKTIAVIGSLHFPQPLGIGVNYYNVYANKPNTWERKFLMLEKQIEEGYINGIILYFATPLLLKSTRSEYSNAWKILVNCLKKTNSLVIIFEENLHGNFEYYDYSEKKFLTLNELNNYIKKLENELLQLKEKEGFLVEKEEKLNGDTDDELDMFNTIRFDDSYSINSKKMFKNYIW